MTNLLKIAFFGLLIACLPVADSYAQRGGGGREGSGRPSFGGGGRPSFGGSGFGGRGTTGGGFSRDRSGGGGSPFGGGTTGGGFDRGRIVTGMVGRYDRNGDGNLEPSEFQAIPERFRGMLQQSGIRGDQPISISDLGQQVARSREGGSAGGDPRQRRDSSRPQPGNTNGQPVPSSFFVMPERVKVIKELSADLKEVDVDQDGMVALYEWTDAGKPFQDYFKLDRNDDGFVTAEEEQGDIELDFARFKSDRLTIVTATSTVASASGKLSFSDKRLGSSRGATRYSKPEEDRKKASDTFDGLDKNRDGRITSEEWAQNQKIKSWFESSKIKLTDMNAEQFSKTYGEAIAKYRQDQEKKKADNGGRRDERRSR